MDYPFAMCGFQSFRDLHSNLHSGSFVERTSAQSLAERLPFNKLHRHEMQVVTLCHFIYMSDVGMNDSRGGFCCAVKPVAGPRDVQQGGGKDFQRNCAVQLCITSTKYNAHSPSADKVQDFVM